MLMNYPVQIPEAPGKLVFREKGNHVYVLYETGRTYDPVSRNTKVERKYIGMQIPQQPELMLPNENYLIYFGEEDQSITEAQENMIRNYEDKREREQMLRGFFDQAYYEFLVMSRKTPESPVRAEKVKRINRILRPLMEMMAGEAYAEFLELIPEQASSEPLTCSDVAMMLTIFKTGVDRYFLTRI